MQHSYPVTQSQLRFWRGAQLAPLNPSYTMVWRFDLHGAVDPGRFAQALAQVVNASDIMSATFQEGAGGVTQRRAEVPFALPPVLDLSLHINAEAALVEHLQTWIAAPFDLSTGTFRAQLVCLAADHWVWLCAQHHIACDAQSGAVLFDLVSRAYAGDLPSDMPAYFPAAQRISDASEAPPKTPRLAQTPPYGAPARRETASTRIPVPLSEVTQETLHILAAKPNFRLFSPDLTKLAHLLTLYTAFVHRITGDAQVVVGLPSHNRLSAAHRKTLGLFVEVLPFAIDVDGGDTFETLFARVKDGLGDFLRRARPNAVAQADGGQAAHVLNFIQARFGDFAGLPASVEWLHAGAHDAQHPIRLHATDFDGAGLRLAFDVQDDVAQKVAAKDIAAQFAMLAEGMTSKTGQPLGTVPLLSSERAAQILTLCTGPSEGNEAARTILERIEVQVSRAPTNIALRMGDQTLSYGDLWTRAGEVACMIGSQATNAGPIAVHMRRSADCIIALIGILRAGHAFVPIAANTPAERVALIFAAAGVVAAFGDETTKAAIAATGVPLLQRASGVVPPTPPQPEDTAYVLFTSGSTGTPKGVEVSHAALGRYIGWAADHFGPKGPKDFAFFSSLSFDLTLTSLFTPLATGGCVVIYPETGETDLAVLDVFAEDAVDVVKLTPSHLSLVCGTGHRVSRIKTLVMGGENLTTGLCRKALDALSSDLMILNEYGPTEAVVGCMIHPFDASKDTEASVPIGTAAAGMAVTIRDAGLSVLPMGIKGEICISGRLATGYHNAPEQTAARFKTLADGTRMYLTGDIGRLRADGRLEYLGRADDQLKIGGVRIETAEIENALRDLPGVSGVHAAVTGAVSQVEPRHHCGQCGLPDTYPGATFDADGICMICQGFESYKDRAQAYFRTEPELTEKIEAAAAKAKGDYDVVMLLSGGKDSTYAAYRLAALTDRVLAVTLDNGFIAEGAKDNIARVVAQLGWDHKYLRTDKMNEIFVDSLNKHSNVCQGCFKAIYTLAIRTAQQLGIPAIVTGLSRGQFFETRLTPELFAKSAPTCAQLEHLVTEARRRYHSEDDAIADLLETGDLADGAFLEQIDIIDIYRFIGVPVSEIYRFLSEQTEWRKPGDTGRSTNCLINDAGILVHKRQEGFHNYALPYSWDVRLGHKTVENALYELNDEIDTPAVEDILTQIGYAPPDDPARLVLYVATDGSVSEGEVRGTLRDRLPNEVQPSAIVILDQLPLTTNGKVDAARLPKPGAAPSETFVAPETEMERQLAQIIAEVTGAADVGRQSDFFDLGVDSLAAVQIAIKANEAGIALPATALFDHRTLRSLAAHAETLTPDVAATTGFDDSFDFDLDGDDLAALGKALS